jgi:hypothetical protein
LRSRNSFQSGSAWSWRRSLLGEDHADVVIIGRKNQQSCLDRQQVGDLRA